MEPSAGDLQPEAVCLRMKAWAKAGTGSLRLKARGWRPEVRGLRAGNRIHVYPEGVEGGRWVDEWIDVCTGKNCPVAS